MVWMFFLLNTAVLEHVACGTPCIKVQNSVKPTESQQLVPCEIILTNRLAVLFCSIMCVIEG